MLKQLSRIRTGLKTLLIVPKGRQSGTNLSVPLPSPRSYGILSPEVVKLFETREKFIAMPLVDKRGNYLVEEFYKFSDLPTWGAYYEANKSTLKSKYEEYVESESIDDQYEKKETLNNKVTLLKGDITKLEVDAIVNAANNSLRGGGGVDGAIHRAAGTELLDECKLLRGCETGDAKLTGGYKLPAKFVIHTVGPRGEKPDLLRSCYESCLSLAVREGIRSIAFPCISTGIYGYPPEAAALVALKTVRTFLNRNSDKMDRIIFCAFLDSDVAIYETFLQHFFPAS